LNYYNYFTEIEETFIRRRGRNLLLSPLDWALIENWQEREVPLHIILRAIETVFDGVDQQPTRKRSVKSLFYCKEEIEAQYAEWLEMQTGKNGTDKVQSTKFKVQASETQHSGLSKNELFSSESIENHLEKTAADLQAAKQKAKGDLRETLGRVLNRLKELEQNITSAEKLEESLEKLDNLIDAELLKSTETEKLSAFKAETEKNLGSYKNKMEAEVYARTFELMLLKRLRETSEIPRLSLFYL
jgi:hypothetical protein